MGAYIVRRLLWVILVVLVVTLLTFAIFFLLPPGDPALRFAGKQPTAQLLATVREQLGLDKPVYEQYGLFVKHLFLGDEWGWPGLGFSYDTRVSVRDELISRAPRSLALVIGAAILWLVMGVAIGIVSALRRRTLIDRLAMGFALFGVSAPVFWLGLMALFIFWQSLEIQSVGTGYVPFAESPFEWFTHLILPWTVLALLYAAFYARMTRGNLIDTLGEDYIRTARAKGLRERRVVVRHGLRSAVTPVVTHAGLDIGVLLGGAILVETVFAIPGNGLLTYDSILEADLPMIQGTVLLGGFFVVVASLVVDVAYRLIDPRVGFA